MKHKFPETMFFSQFPGNFFGYNNILITMKKDAVFNLTHPSKYSKSYFPTTLITCDCGYTYIRQAQPSRVFRETAVVKTLEIH